MPPDECAGRDIPVASTPAEPDRRKRLRLLVARLPVDPDLAPAVTPPLRHGPTAVVVAVGGVAGACARHALALAWPHHAGSWPWSPLLTNVSGCLGLAVLLVVLVVRLPRARYIRPLLGTGVLGGYTTFSTFTVDVVQMVHAERLLSAAGYVVTMVVGMIFAVLLGLVLARAALRLANPHRWHRQIHHARVTPGGDRP